MFASRLPPTPCDLRRERAALSARARAPRDRSAARGRCNCPGTSTPAPLATTTGGVQITYEPSLMGGGIALAVMLVMYMYAMELAMFNPEPP